MSDVVAPEFVRFIAGERSADRFPAPPQALAEGELFHPVTVDGKRATEFLRIAARRAVGLFRATNRREVVWVEGDRELAVGLAELRVTLGNGLLQIGIPVRSDQTGAVMVEVPFAVGGPGNPAGLFASTHRRPIGPPLIVDAWGDALVAFAWQCLLGLLTGIAGATGKDARGNVLVPVELTVTPRALSVLPMARHRFSGSSGLRPTVKRSAPR